MLFQAEQHCLQSPCLPTAGLPGSGLCWEMSFMVTWLLWVMAVSVTALSVVGAAVVVGTGRRNG